MNQEPAPGWKFWHPLPFWQVIVIFLVFTIACQLLGVFLREQAGLTWFTGSIAAGLSGGAGVTLVMILAQRRRNAADAPSDSP